MNQFIELLLSGNLSGKFSNIRRSASEFAEAEIAYFDALKDTVISYTVFVLIGVLFLVQLIFALCTVLVLTLLFAITEIIQVSTPLYTLIVGGVCILLVAGVTAFFTWHNIKKLRFLTSSYLKHWSASNDEISIT